MARMIGKTQWHQTCRYGCCRGWVNIHTAKRREEAAWKSEVADELYEDHKHDRGICYNPPGGYGCEECYFDYDYYDNSELDDIPGVWCNVDYRNDPWWQRALEEERAYA